MSGPNCRLFSHVSTTRRSYAAVCHPAGTNQHLISVRMHPPFRGTAGRRCASDLDPGHVRVWYGIVYPDTTLGHFSETCWLEILSFVSAAVPHIRRLTGEYADCHGVHVRARTRTLARTHTHTATRPTSPPTPHSNNAQAMKVGGSCSEPVTLPHTHKTNALGSGGGGVCADPMETSRLESPAPPPVAPNSKASF